MHNGRLRTMCVVVMYALFCFVAISAFAQHAAKGNGNSDDAGTASQRAAVDPKTGKLRAPTPEELQVLTAPLANNESTEGLVPTTLPNGAVAIDLQGRFETSMMVKKEADGSISRACVSNAKQAEAFLKSEQKQPATKKTSPQDLEVK